MPKHVKWKVIAGKTPMVDVVSENGDAVYLDACPDIAAQIVADHNAIIELAAVKLPSGFTPGPWQADRLTVGKDTAIRGDGIKIAVVAYQGSAAQLRKDAANAAAIAAVPTLIAAIQSATKHTR